MVHPIVKEAENFRYQVWPVDETHIWIARFSTQPYRRPSWRAVKKIPETVKVTDGKNTTLKCGKKGGAVASNKKIKPEKHVPSARKKIKVAKVKGVRKTESVEFSLLLTPGKKFKSEDALKAKKA